MKKYGKGNTYKVRRTTDGFKVTYLGGFGHLTSQGTFPKREDANDMADRLNKRKRKFDNRRKIQGNR